MRTKRNSILIPILILVVVALVPVAASAQTTFKVTITNTTYGQITAPPILVTHSTKAALFRTGAQASPGLALLAEDGDASMMANSLSANREVLDVVVGDGVILPGESYEMEIRANGKYSRLSIAGMLVSTNDAFYGLDAVPLFEGSRRQTVFGAVYDAGSEANNEDCAFIPGPPCGNPGVRDTADAEGFVHVHRGIQGVGDLAPEMLDWRNPGVEIEILRTSR